ncbi:MAG: acyl-CoA desaturase [Limnothrix sp. RL_2_0]|nr:acyl-CoA desaturase [Limnothrix sp. RL_2_0]
MDPIRFLPIIFVHLGCLGVFFVGWSWTAVAIAFGFYFLRMFAITGFYHRYFSHRSFSTSRPLQFVFAFLGNTAGQRGALWWAAHHRHHHQHSDDEHDAHSPVSRSFFWSHVGWVTNPRNFPTNYKVVKDLTKFPELVWLNRFDQIAPLLFLGMTFGLGVALNALWPNLGTSGGQILVWGFFISTSLLFHGTFSINSLSHKFGTQRYDTGDDSRNNFWLALITLGEGWHNNHHRYMNSTRQGFFWWEVDITFYLLKMLSFTGLIWDLRPVPAAIYKEQ